MSVTKAHTHTHTHRGVSYARFFAGHLPMDTYRRHQAVWAMLCALCVPLKRALPCVCVRVCVHRVAVEEDKMFAQFAVKERQVDEEYERIRKVRTHTHTHTHTLDMRVVWTEAQRSV